jgi:predicted transcriptional regulator
MEENVGFILGNPQRERVLRVLSSKGKMTTERIAKVEHIPLQTIKRIMNEMAERGIIKDEGGSWNLTEMGQEVDKEIKKRA